VAAAGYTFRIAPPSLPAQFTHKLDKRLAATVTGLCVQACQRGRNQICQSSPHASRLKV